MQKTLALVALGFASSNAIWTWPAEDTLGFIEEYDEWQGIMLPEESSFPWKDTSDWFHSGQSQYNDVAPGWFNLWYVTGGAFDWRTEYASGNAFDATATHGNWYQQYSVIPVNMSGDLTVTTELFKWMFGTLNFTAALGKATAVQFAFWLPTQLNYWWSDNATESTVGIQLKTGVSMVDWWYAMFGAMRSCTGDLLKSIDEEEF
jgi:hypothetical protein